MFERVVHRLDTISALVRWIALLGVLPVTFLTVPSGPDSPTWAILIMTAVMAVLDAIPVVLLLLESFPQRAALVFVILDSVYALLLVYLGGPGMGFYLFVPATTMSIRFDWTMGLIGGVALAVGLVLLALLRVGFRGLEQILPTLLFQSLGLLMTSLLGGLLAENLKKEPPVENPEARRLRKELKQLRQAADRSWAIYEMASMLGATLNADTILDAVLELSAVGFEELTEEATGLRERAASVVLLFGHKGMYIAASRNIIPKEASEILDGNRGVLDQVLKRAEPMIFGNLADDLELRKLTPFRRCRSAICVPLRAGFELYGVVLFASPTPNAFGSEHADLLRAISNQASVALSNAHLYRDVQQEKERLLEVGEEERSKLARNLHDGPTQSVSAIAMRLNFARLLLEREPQKVRDELFKLENLARRTTKEIRTMLFTLRPVVLETQGLRVAVEQLVEKHKETGDLPVTLEIDAIENQVDTNVKAVAWFVTEEALNNAKKYANAEHVWVRMTVCDGHFVAEIEDDGDGFDYEETMATYDQRGSFGLLNFQERASLVNGRCVVRTAMGKGTKVTLVVPLDQEVI